MDRAALRSLVISNTNRTDKLALIDSALNLAVSDLARRHDFADLRDTQDLAIAADDVSVALPDGTRNVIELRLIDGQYSHPMELREKSVVVGQLPNPEATVGGWKPRTAYIEAGTLYFVPKSNGDYTIRITRRKYPTDMAADADTPSIRDADDAIAAYASAYVLRSVGMHSDAAVFQSAYETAAAARIRDDMRDPGLTVQADSWRRQKPGVSAAPWLDPFAGLPLGGEW